LFLYAILSVVLLINVYYYTYLSTDPIDGRMYIGSRGSKCKPCEDIKYFGSFKDKTFKPTIKKILKLFNSRKEAFKHEIYLHAILNVANNPLFANQINAATKFTWAGQKHTEETKKKISKASKEIYKNMSEEKKMLIKQVRKNKKMSEKHKELLRKINLGAKRSDETKEKIRKAAQNRKLSNETKKKISEINKGKWINRPDQSKSIALQNIKTNQIRFFISQKEAVRQLGMHQASLNRVALGKQVSSCGWILYKV